MSDYDLRGIVSLPEEYRSWLLVCSARPTPDVWRGIVQEDEDDVAGAYELDLDAVAPLYEWNGTVFLAIDASVDADKAVYQSDHGFVVYEGAWDDEGPPERVQLDPEGAEELGVIPGTANGVYLFDSVYALDEVEDVDYCNYVGSAFLHLDNAGRSLKCSRHVEGDPENPRLLATIFDWR